MKNHNQSRMMIATILLFALACLTIAPDVYAFFGAAMNEFIFPAYNSGLNALGGALRCLRFTLLCIILPGSSIAYILWRATNKPQPPAPPTE